MESKKKNSGSTQMFLFALGIMTFFYGMKQIYLLSDNSIIESINDYIQIISYFILLIVIFKKSFNSKWLKYIFIVGVIILLGLDRTRSTSILRLFLLVLASRDMSYRKIIKTLLVTYCSVLCLSIFLYVCGVSNPNVSEGLSLGFTHPNVAALVVTTIMFLWLCLKEKLDLLTMIIYLLVAAFVFLFLHTRVAAICLALFPIIHRIIRIGSKKRNKVIKYLTCYSQVIMCALSIVMVVIYPMSFYNPFRSRIDQLLAYRPYLNFNNIMKYGVSIWGQNVNIYNTSEYAYNYFTGAVSNQKFNTVDNAYILGIIATGVIPMIITMICFVLVQKKAWKNRNTILLSIGVMFALYAFIENGANEALFVFPYYYLVTKDDTKIVKAYERKHMVFKIAMQRRYGVDT